MSIRSSIFPCKLKDKVTSKMDNMFNFHAHNIENLLTFQLKAQYLHEKCIYSRESGISIDKYFDKDVIVSLTTYGTRIYDVYLTIESIMQQTIRPNKIILWLDNSFKNKDLPITLTRQINRGLEVNYCKDILSYKKLIYTLFSYPEDIIITVDDDAIYNFDLLENMITEYNRQPDLIYANRMRRIIISKDGIVEKYREWPHVNDYEISTLNVPIGVGGVLYPPHALSSEVFNEAFFMENCRFADDIWFKAMALKNGTLCKKINTHEPIFYSNQSVQDIALANQNLFMDRNDQQIKRVFDTYNISSLL